MAQWNGTGSKYVYEGQLSIAVFTDASKPNERADVIFASATTPLYTYYELWKGDGYTKHHNERVNNGTAYTYDNKTVYVAISNMPYFGLWGEFPIEINPIKSSYGAESNAIAWTMIYGKREETPAGSTQTIPVQWHRPGDGKSLYDSFEITVINADNSGSGQDPQPAPTPSPD